MYEPGAYTGEVAAEHFNDYGMEWVLIGHSERRNLFGETSDIIAKKMKLARDNHLNVVYCIGENLEQREKEQTNKVLEEQLTIVLQIISSSQGGWNGIVIAYEPVWAIGTGKIASADQTQEAHEFIRSWVKSTAGEKIANELRIIYGGSVTETNCENLIKLNDVDGFLVGTSSIKPGFRDIFETVYAQAIAK
jgi:triosephosphate isomerase